jgi:hypothetical protein
MLVESIGDIEDIDVGDLHRRYRRELGDVIETVGVETVARETGIARERLALLPAEDPGLTLADAAAILSTAPDRPDAGSIRQEVRDHLLLTMSSAVVDVDALATAMGGDLEPRDYQQMIEGTMAMPLAEYARIRYYLETKNPY